jgi:hypothetical protein
MNGGSRSLTILNPSVTSGLSWESVWIVIGTVRSPLESGIPMAESTAIPPGSTSVGFTVAFVHPQVVSTEVIRTVVRPTFCSENSASAVICWIPSRTGGDLQMIVGDVATNLPRVGRIEMRRSNNAEYVRSELAAASSKRPTNFRFLNAFTIVPPTLLLQATLILAPHALCFK